MPPLLSVKWRCPIVSPWSLVLAGCLGLSGLSASSGDVIVIANRTRQDVPCRVLLGNQPRSITIATGSQQILRHPGPCQILYEVSGELVRYQLDTDSAYFFALDQQGWLELSKIDLGGASEAMEPPDGPDEVEPARVERSGVPAEPSATPLTDSLPIKILVDNREPTPRSAWEPRLRKRIDRVSDLLQAQCGLRLSIVAVETWDSGLEPVDFKQGLSDFRQRVEPQPGRLAIGFTGRYQQEGGRVDLGGTQGMLQSHILIREWADAMSEPERDEVLLHEIGHYLGAVHSPDPGSVMRPVLADDKAIRRAFQIGFDPVNALIINLVADEIRGHGAEHVADLTLATRRRLLEIYATLSKALPDDQSARQYQFQLGAAGDTPVVQAARLVVREVHRAARARVLESDGATAGLSADELTEYYVRRAATLALTLPGDVAPSALLLGLGIALDDSDTLERSSLTRAFCQQVETELERQERHRTLGRPTIRGRRDLAQHFFLSAYLTAVVGAPAAESAGLAKEIADSRTQSGFSYRDFAADLAGIEFARRLLVGHLSLSQVASRFAVADLMPAVDDLPEGLRWSDIGPQLQGHDKGSVADYRREIRHRIGILSQTPDPR